MTVTSAQHSKLECVQLDRFDRIEGDVLRLHTELNGNGRAGVREELIELRVSVRAMTRIGWIILGTVIVNLAGAVYRIAQ